jgi:hypothetical protein
MTRTYQPDADQWLVFDPASWDRSGAVYVSENEAYDFWAENQDQEVVQFNPVEGYSRSVTDDFGERYAAENTRIAIRQRMVRCPSAHHARAS